MSAFYKSAMTLCVGTIEREDFRPFLRERFRATGRAVSDVVLDAVAAEANDIPGDVQELCEALCVATEGRKKIGMSDVAEALKIVYAREGDKFESFTARRALSRLEELRYIYSFRGEWRFNSTFFRSWLKRFA